MAKTATKVQVSSVTGLTPTQERACSLLASGAKTAEVAQKLDVPGKLYTSGRNKLPLCATITSSLLYHRQATERRNRKDGHSRSC